ncbi:hypothetical protein [Klebsiella oxytoca]|nr:hypothetical protein [Klebsiella oxytoca]HCB2157734.1 hypothetical protein [Klebsiella oxytoca]
MRKSPLCGDILLPTENLVLWAWSSTGFGSALLSLDLNLRELAETSF